MNRFHCLLPVFLVALLPIVAHAETITVATYNIENFREHFLAHKVQQEAATRPAAAPDPGMKEILTSLRAANDEDNWEIASVIRDEKVSPDILVFQEGCEQSDLDYFNKRWLEGMFATAIVFDTNTTRTQTLGILLKPGFKIVEKKTDYYKEPDPVPNPRGERLFARGPAFVLVEAPSGYRFWVGTTHMKSKSGNSAEVTAWRNREAVRTRQILLELEKSGTPDVIFLGDCNDTLGVGEFEAESGGDTIANLVGGPETGLFLATQKLIDAGATSFGGYSRERYDGMIDQVIVTKEMKDQIKDVYLYREGLAKVASDHYPVIVKVDADPSPTTRP